MPSGKERAWGTRYDTLDSSPPPASPSRQTLSPSTTPNSPVTSIIASSKDLSGDDTCSSHTSTVRSQPDRLPHDASVFVGSLPVHFDHAELTRLLHEHMSQHAEVKSIKVVRDNKGSTCAFVQCEDAVAASRLIHALQSAPRPFLGRMLRYEPARAFRMLLVSYCRPTKVAYHIEGLGNAVEHMENPLVAMQLPTAMRIYRPRGSRFFTILYDDKARSFDFTTPDEDERTSRRDSYSGAGIIIDPMEFNAENMHKIMSAFGSVEHIATCPPDIAESDDSTHTPEKTHAPPHNAPRLPLMNPSVWEVKWGHRDDCVAALMTLRRVPFLNVSWAHHSPDFPNGARHGSQFPLGARFLNLSSPQAAEVQMRLGGNGMSPVEQSDQTPSTKTWTSTCDAQSPQHLTLPYLPVSNVQPGCFPAEHESEFSRTPDEESIRSHIESLKDPFMFCDVEDNRPWGDREMPTDTPDESGALASSVSPPPMHPSTASSENIQNSQHAHGLVHTRSLPMSSIKSQPTYQGMTRRHSVLPPHDASVVSHSSSTSKIRPASTGIPASLAHSPTVTPVENPELSDFGHLNPLAPAKGANDSDGYDWCSNDRRELDPTTIFVGGLEMFGLNAWDEAKLYRHFEVYGGIETVQLVRPMNKRSAFAFIKFKDTEGSVRAVENEHNRMHNGRQMRVQLRDNNPQRGSWRFGRGRGKIASTGRLSPPSDVGYAGNIQTASLGRQGMVTSTSSTTQDTRRVPLSNTSPAPPSLLQTEPWRSDAGAMRDQGQASAHGLHISSPSQDKSESVMSSLSSSTTKVSFPTSGALYDESAAPMASLTPPLSTSSTGLSVPSTSGSLQHYGPSQSVGYYPQHWAPAIPYYPYAVPLVPHYPLLHQQPLQQGPLPSRVQDETTLAGSQNPWSAMPNAYKPMMPYMVNPVNPGNEQMQPQVSQPSMQPPVRATGFIQGEHGTLIPVYQPEALHQYLSNVDQSRPPLHMPASATPTPIWPQYPQIAMYPYPFPMHHVAHAQQPQMPRQHSWMANPATLPSPGMQEPQPDQQHAFQYMTAATPSGYFGNSHGGPPQPSQHNGHHGNLARRYPRREVNQPHRAQHARLSQNQSTRGVGGGPPNAPRGFTDHCAS